MFIIYKTHNPFNSVGQIDEYVFSTHFEDKAKKYCEAQNEMKHDPIVIWGYRKERFGFEEDYWYGAK